MSDTTLIDRALIRLSGEGVRDFLQGLVTSDVNGDLPVWSGLLTPQGKALFDFIVWADGDDLLIDCEASQADPLTKRLTLYRLRKPIQIERETKLAVHWSKTEPSKLIRHHVTNSGPWPQSIRPDPRLAALGYRWLAPPDGAAEGWRAHRLSLGVPEGVDELGSDKYLWLECNADLLNGVSFSKGCYVGQENTARMNWRNKVNRRLVALPDGTVERRPVDSLDPATLPEWLGAALAQGA